MKPPSFLGGGSLPTLPSTLYSPSSSAVLVCGNCEGSSPRLRQSRAGRPGGGRAVQLLDEIRPKLINQTLSMNENVIKEINCRNTCTNKNPLTYLPGIPVRKH